MSVSVDWADRDNAIIIFTLQDVVITQPYQAVLEQIEAMSEELHKVSLIIFYDKDFVVQSDGFVSRAKQFYQFMHKLELCWVIVATGNDAIMGLWEGTLALYKIEPPKYSFAPSVDEAVKQIRQWRQSL